MTTPRNRRRHTRYSIEKACKVYHPASRRYSGGQTVNVSDGGAMVLVDGWRPLSAGEELDVVIAWTAKPVLPADSMLRGRVVRSTLDDAGRQVVAVEFDEAVAVRVAA